MKTYGAISHFILKDGKSVMVQGSIKYKNTSQFPLNLCLQIISTNKLQYAFWRYTNKGHVKNVEAMEYDVEMYAYNGTMGQYKQLYGDLTQ